MLRARTKLLCTTLLVSSLAMGAAPFAPSLFVAPAQAQQRVEIRQAFRVALEPHGKFQRHAKFGEVWRPARVSRDWRPYTVGRWIYTDDWGWYWNAADAEADWGWVVFHYGRWINDSQMGWVWAPGDEWGPAWVNWRRGEGPAAGGRANANMRYIGWAPLPPEGIAVDYRDNPEVWMFVRASDIIAPRVNRVLIRERRPEILQRTVIVNRTIIVRDRGVIVNPGIQPSYIAAYAGRPIVSYQVRPRVVAGTARIDNAVELRVEDLRDRRRLQRLRKEAPLVRETRTRIEPVREVPEPRALAPNEEGRLGDRPPRAAARDQRQERNMREGAARDGTARDGATREGQRRDGVKPDGAMRDGQRRESVSGEGRERDQRQTRDQRERPAGDRDRPKGERASGEPPNERSSAGRSSPDGGPSTGRNAAGTDKPTQQAKPDQRQTPPRQAAETPGQAAKTPGQSSAKPPGQAQTAPGRAGEAPGRSADAPARQQERGGGRGETTGATPDRRSDSERARQRGPQKPDAAEPKGASQ